MLDKLIKLKNYFFPSAKYAIGNDAWGVLTKKQKDSLDMQMHIWYKFAVVFNYLGISFALILAVGTIGLAFANPNNQPVVPAQQKISATNLPIGAKIGLGLATSGILALCLRQGAKSSSKFAVKRATKMLERGSR